MELLPLKLTAAENRRALLFSAAGRLFLLGATSLSLLGILLIFYFVIKEGASFFTSINLWDVLTSTKWHPEDSEHPEYGIAAILVGSFYVTFCAILVAAPLGILCAVFLSDILPRRLRNYAKPIVELLAAIPSVAYGFFALLVLAPWLQENLGFTSGVCILNASLLIAVMALPTMVSVSEDVLTAVGREVRESSYSLGATRKETVLRVVLPQARRGIGVAVMLGTMRAVGETMVVWMAAGNSNQVPTPWWDLGTSVRTLTATIAAEMGEAANGSGHYHSLFGLATILLVIIFLLNAVVLWFQRGGKNA